MYVSSNLRGSVDVTLTLILSCESQLALTYTFVSAFVFNNDVTMKQLLRIDPTVIYVRISSSITHENFQTRVQRFVSNY